MDFDEFEQLVLKVLFETDVPVTAAHVAYLGRVSVRTAERHLARMVEHGTLLVRTSAAGVVEYVYPGRKPLVQNPGNGALVAGFVGPPPISAGDSFFLTLRISKPRPSRSSETSSGIQPPSRSVCIAHSIAARSTAGSRSDTSV